MDTLASSPFVDSSCPWTSEKGALYGWRSVVYCGHILAIAVSEHKFLVHPVSIMAIIFCVFNSSNKIGDSFIKGKKFVVFPSIFPVSGECTL